MFTWVPFEEDSRFGSDPDGETAALRQTASAAIFATVIDIEMIKNGGNIIEQSTGNRKRESFTLEWSLQRIINLIFNHIWWM